MTDQKNEMPMMGMMRKMMGNADDTNPTEMSKEILSSIAKASEMAFYATPEIRSMFEEWLESIEIEIFDFIQLTGEVNPEKVAKKFKISKTAAHFFLNHLAAAGKIKAEFK